MTRLTILTNVALSALGFITAILYARWLGPIGRGQLAAAMLWPTMILGLGSVGLSAATTFYVASATRRREQHTIWQVSLLLALLQSLVLVPLCIIAISLFLSNTAPSVQDLGILFTLVLPISLIGQSGVAVLLGQRKSIAFNGIRAMLPAGILLSASALALWSTLSVAALVWLNLIWNLVATVLVSGLLLCHFARSRADRITSIRQTARNLILYGAKGALGESSQVLNLRLDQAIIAAFLTTRALGLYVAAVAAAGVGRVVSLGVRMTVGPEVADALRRKENGLALGEERFRRFSLIIGALTVALLVTLPRAVPLVFGPDFQQAVLPCELLVVASFPLALRDILTGICQGLGDPWTPSRAELQALGVTVLLLPGAVALYGITGAALVSIAAYSCSLALLLWRMRLRHGFRVR